MEESNQLSRIGEIESSISKIECDLKMLQNRIEGLSSLHVTSARAKEAKRLTLGAMEERLKTLFEMVSDSHVELEVEWVKARSGEDYVEPPIEDKIYE